jgi:hypothetical protein
MSGPTRVTEKVATTSVEQLVAEAITPVEEVVASGGFTAPAATGTFAAAQAATAPPAPVQVEPTSTGTFTKTAEPIAPPAQGSFRVTPKLNVTFEHSVFVPPPPPPVPPRRGTFYYPYEMYLGCFPRVTMFEPPMQGRKFNFEEARRVIANRNIGLSHFAAKAMMGGELSTFEEHRTFDLAFPPDGAAREWKRFVGMALEMRQFLIDDLEKLFLQVPNEAVRLAMLWSGHKPTNVDNDLEIMADVLALGGRHVYATGPVAALLDVCIYRYAALWGREGVATDLALEMATSSRPSYPVENLLFDRGLHPGTRYIKVPEAEGVEVDAALLGGTYIVDEVVYQSALGWKAEGTVGDTIGWRQMHMSPLVEQELPNAA